MLKISCKYLNLCLIRTTIKLFSLDEPLKSMFSWLSRRKEWLDSRLYTSWVECIIERENSVSYVSLRIDILVGNVSRFQNKFLEILYEDYEKIGKSRFSNFVARIVDQMKKEILYSWSRSNSSCVLALLFSSGRNILSCCDTVLQVYILSRVSSCYHMLWYNEIEYACMLIIDKFLSKKIKVLCIFYSRITYIEICVYRK